MGWVAAFRAWKVEVEKPSADTIGVIHLQYIAVIGCRERVDISQTETKLRQISSSKTGVLKNRESWVWRPVRAYVRCSGVNSLRSGIDTAGLTDAVNKLASFLRERAYRCVPVFC